MSLKEIIFPTNGLLSKPLIRPSGSKPYDFKVCMVVCTHRDVQVQVFRLLKDLLLCPNPKIELHAVTGDALIDRARSLAASRFMESDSDVLFFLDDDITISPYNATNLMWEMWKHDFDILGAPYPLKSETEKCFALRTLENQEEIPCGENSGIAEVMFISSGCMLVRKRVFQKMKETLHYCQDGDFNLWPFFTPMEAEIKNKWCYLSEDWAFCQRAKQLGMKVHCDFTVKLGHTGRYTYTWDDFFREPVDKKDDIIYGVNVPT